MNYRSEPVRLLFLLFLCATLNPMSSPIQNPPEGYRHSVLLYVEYNGTFKVSRVCFPMLRETPRLFLRSFFTDRLNILLSFPSFTFGYESVIFTYVS